MRTSIDSTGAVMIAVLMLVAGLIIGSFSGWVIAHNTVSHECDRLGAFYVGDKTFWCVQK
jgi:hypothetical protein